MWKPPDKLRTIALALTLAASAAVEGCAPENLTKPTAIVRPVVTAVTTGGQFDIDGYQVQVWRAGSDPELEQPLAVRRMDVNDTLVIDGLGSGPYGIRLTDVAQNCSVDQDTWRMTESPFPAPVAFNVSCRPSRELGDLRMVFSSDRSGRTALFAMQMDGSGLSQLTRDPVYYDGDADLSSDGSRIAFVKSPPDEMWFPPEDLVGIYVMNADGSGLARLTSHWSSTPDWSPDGSHIAFGDLAGLWTMEADGRDHTPLEARVHLVGGGWDPDWAPDGQRIVFARENGIWIVNADGSGLHSVVSPLRASGPIWSPDGSRIAFSAYDAVEKTSAVYVMKTDGSDIVRLTDPGRWAQADAWSPDGTQVVITAEWLGNLDIYLVGLDGALVRITADPSWDLEPTVSTRRSPGLHQVILSRLGRSRLPGGHRHAICPCRTGHKRAHLSLA